VSEALDALNERLYDGLPLNRQRCFWYKQLGDNATQALCSFF